MKNAMRATSIDTSISDTHVIEVRHHAEMMKRSHLWSYGGLALPLKRQWSGSGGGQLGCIFSAPGEPPFRVRLGNVFAVAFGESSIHEMPFIDYDTAEDAVRDGWVVD